LFSVDQAGRRGGVVPRPDEDQPDRRRSLSDGQRELSVSAGHHGSGCQWRRRLALLSNQFLRAVHQRLQAGCHW